MELPIYKLKIKGDDSLGVDYVALVDEPAIKRYWQFFNKQQSQHFSIDNEEKRIISGPLMLANMPIYRRSKVMGEYYAVFDAETIKDVALKFFKENRIAAVNVMHESSATVEGVFLFESFFIDRERGINPPKGYDDIADGSWFASYKVNNDDVWQEVKAGTFKGFSVEGLFDMEREKTEEEMMLDTIIEILNRTKNT